MFSKIISRQDLPKLVDKLLNDFFVIAPTYEKNVPTLSKISNSSEVEYDFMFKEKLPMLPTKKVFFPGKQTLFHYSLKDGMGNEGCGSLIDKKYDKNIVILGISPCDISGTNVLDRIFGDTFSDDIYLRMREKTTIIGVNCLDHCYENCFCETMSSNDPKTGFDIMLTEISKNRLIAIPNSDKGKQILRLNSTTFTEVTAKDNKDYLKALQMKQKNFKIEFPAEGLASQIEDNFESEVWEEFTKRCLFCGSCTFVCPTCYCYTTNDVLSINLQEGERQREWDSCYFPEFALVAGDHDFRGKKTQRFRYRYLHKFVDLPRRNNLEGCVGCGRCTTYCPANIDVRDVLKKIRGEN